MVGEQQTKNLVIQKSREYEIKPDIMYRLYALEQFLKRVSDSEYKDNFVLKGGYLITAKYGLDMRSTADLDSTIRYLDLSRDVALRLVDAVTRKNEDDSEYFQLVGLKETREGFLYSGFEVRLDYINGKLRTPISIDLTAGEDLLPVEGYSELNLMFEEGSLHLACYPLEQILSDKFYTLLSYGRIDDTNSRSKDLYDMYFLTTFHADEIDYVKLHLSLMMTFRQREFMIALSEADRIIERLENSTLQKDFWMKYQNQSIYARGISFDETMNAVRKLSVQIQLVHDQNPDHYDSERSEELSEMEISNLDTAEEAFKRLIKTFELTASPEQAQLAQAIRQELAPNLELIVFNLNNQERWLLINTNDVALSRQIEIMRHELGNNGIGQENYLADEKVFNWLKHHVSKLLQEDIKQYARRENVTAKNRIKL